MFDSTLTRRAAAAAAVLTLSLVTSVAAQDAQNTGPLANFIVAGYGGTTYEATLDNDFGNNFTASISPVLLFTLGEDVLFESELEFGLSGDLTTTTLEYAQIDYLAFEQVQIIAGKFLVPFGLFGERIHPTWINKLPTAPLLFGHAHGGVAEGALLPVLSDAGAMVRFNQPMGSAWHLDLSAYVTQGPRLVTETEAETDGHGHDGFTHVAAADAAADAAAGSTDGTFDVPTVGFGVAFNDNNKNKMLGGRLGFVKGPSVEVYLSGFHAMYDVENYLDYKGAAISFEARRAGWEFRTEGAFLWQEFELDDGSFATLESPGYYLQLSRRYGDFEPVVRWSQLLDADVDGEVARTGVEELALGVNYWLSPTIPLKVAWDVDPDTDDRLLLQWAFGF